MTVNPEELVNLFMTFGDETTTRCESQDELIGVMSQFMYQAYIICLSLNNGDEQKAYEYMFIQTANLFKPKMN